MDPFWDKRTEWRLAPHKLTVMLHTHNVPSDRKPLADFLRVQHTVVAAMTGLVTFGLLCASALLLGKVEQAQQELQAFDLDRALIVSATWSGPITMQTSGSNRPTGTIDQFLMTLESADALAKIEGIDAMHEYRAQSRDVVQGAGEVTSARLVVVPPGFMQAHHLGGDEVNALLQQGCVVASTDWISKQRWNLQQPVHWMLPADIRKKLTERAAMQRAQNLPVLDTGEFDAPLCPASLTLPRGIAMFEDVAFISTEHTALQGRTSGALPQLWLSVSPNADPATTFRRVEDFLAHVAQPAQPTITLHVNTFSDHSVQAVNSEQIGAWQRRLHGLAWLVGLALLMTLVFVRWGALRRELALRQALGQSRQTAWARVTRPYGLAIMGGTVMGALLAGTASVVFVAVPWSSVVLQSGQLALVSATAVAILGALTAWCMREAPMLVLNRGAR